jgi:RsiW-degrading membrane proteinase PrsW (M82 family)
MTKTATIELHKPAIGELLFFLLSGAIVSIPLTLFLEQNFEAPLTNGLPAVTVSLITIVVFAPLVEEFSKVFPLFYRHGETQRSIFTLALCVGLGFGIVEFVTYVVLYGVVIIPDRIPGLFFHPASASITAYGIATRRPLPYYLAAVGLHFTNNFFAVTVPTLPISFLILLVTLLTSWRLHAKAKNVFVRCEHLSCSEPER